MMEATPRNFQEYFLTFPPLMTLRESIFFQYFLTIQLYEKNQKRISHRFIMVSCNAFNAILIRVIFILEDFSTEEILPLVLRNASQRNDSVCLLSLTTINKPKLKPERLEMRHVLLWCTCIAGPRRAGLHYKAKERLGLERRFTPGTRTTSLWVIIMTPAL